MVRCRSPRAPCFFYTGHSWRLMRRGARRAVASTMASRNVQDRRGAAAHDARVPREQIVVLDAPSNLGLRPSRPGALPGVYRLPAALRATGLVDRLAARDGGVVTPPAYSPEPDLETGYRNGTSLAAYSAALAERSGAVVAAGDFLLVLGGDCSVLLGNTLALRRRGRYGLVFIDGHDDFSPTLHPEKYRGIITAAGTDLALVTGHGPAALTDLSGLRPYVREEDVALFAMYRDPEDKKSVDISVIERTPIRRYPIELVRERGARAAAEQALAALDRQPIDGFWIHLDADVLDESIMPAVDSPNPEGMTFDELVAALAVFLASPRAVGLELTIFDPDLDPDGAYARQLADALVRAFAAAGRVAAGAAQPG